MTISGDSKERRESDTTARRQSALTMHEISEMQAKKAATPNTVGQTLSWLGASALLLALLAYLIL